MLRNRFVNTVYADHNQSRSVQKMLSSCLADLPVNGSGLNVGAGSGRLDPRITNVDIVDGADIDVVAFAESLPFEDRCFDLAISQETLEHVQDPFRAVREMYRVLKDGGQIYVQVPFIIGYHPGPTDYWRFTREGVQELVNQAGFQIDQVGITVGPAVGYYRIAVEFMASLAASILLPAYIPAKASFALFLYPIKLLDRFIRLQRDRIAGGYYVVATKPLAVPDSQPINGNNPSNAQED